jgi:restriction system protein
MAVTSPHPALARASRGGLAPELLRSLELKRLELIVAHYYRATGLRAEYTGTAPDRRVGVKLFRPDSGEPYAYIHCRSGGPEKVTLPVIQRFFDVMATDRITEGVFLAMSDYSPDARAFAKANGIVALTADDFVRMFGELDQETRSRILTEVTPGVASAGTADGRGQTRNIGQW